MASLTFKFHILHVFLLFGLVFVSESINNEQDMNLTVGDDLTLQCRFSRDDKILMLLWTRPDLQSDGYVFFYRDGRSYDKYHHPQFQDRVNITEINNESLTVTLHNVIVTDSGRYECHVTVEGTGRSRRGHTEVKDVIKLTVSHRGTNKDGGDKDGGDKDGGDKDEGNEDRNSRGHGLAAGLIATALIVVVVVFVILFKNCIKKNLYLPPDKVCVKEPL